MGVQACRLPGLKRLHSLQGFKGFKGKRLRPGKRQAWTPITGCKSFKGFEGFRGLRAGNRQAWTPIRSHWCVALGPAANRHPKATNQWLLMGVQACRLPALNAIA